MNATICSRCSSEHRLSKEYDHEFMTQPTSKMGGTITKQYIGEAVYVNFDGVGIILTTEDGISVSNTIYLEPEVYAELETVCESVKG